MIMAKEKVTLTLDTDVLRELRETVGARSLSATVEVALRDYLARVRHLHAVDKWLAEMEREHGPIPPKTLDWAAQVFEEWESGGKRKRRRSP